VKNILLILVIIALGLVAFTKVNGPPRILQASLEAPASALEPAAAAVPAPKPREQSRFSCDGRTMCTQMRSCAEAQYFLEHCPTTRMDGDHDGQPCEDQWCRHDPEA
jgi:hypothetical protein